MYHIMLSDLKYALFSHYTVNQITTLGPNQNVCETMA